MTLAPARRGACLAATAGAWRQPGLLLAAALLACTTGGRRPTADDERLAELEAQTAALEESLEALAEQKRAGWSARSRRCARNSRARGRRTPGTPTGDRLDDLDARLQAIEEIFARLDALLPGWGAMDRGRRQGVGATGRRGRGANRAAREGLRRPGPLRRPPGTRRSLGPRDPLGASWPVRRRSSSRCTGFGSDSASQAAYIPLHERVNTRGFALLLPNGTHDDMGNRFWNPTDECCDGGKSGEDDDVAYLTELVAEARSIVGSGAVYVFGYSNGGFMSHHLACKGLPGLRAVASLAGHELRRGLQLRGRTPRLRTPHPRHRRRRDPVRRRRE